MPEEFSRRSPVAFAHLDVKLVCWFPGVMKATFDLPDDLVQRIKLRAVRERKPLKRVVADLLTQSLDGPETPTGTADHTSPPEGVMLTEDG